MLKFNKVLKIKTYGHHFTLVINVQLRNVHRHFSCLKKVNDMESSVRLNSTLQLFNRPSYCNAPCLQSSKEARRTAGLASGSWLESIGWRALRWVGECRHCLRSCQAKRMGSQRFLLQQNVGYNDDKSTWEISTEDQKNNTWSTWNYVLTST